MKKLQEIQQKLKVPKGRYSSFGEYHYRSVDEILGAVKPLLGECTLLLSDEVKEVGGKVYIGATAFFADTDGNNEIVTAWAREEEERKKAVAPQLTGSASTYARKRALEGLFLLDNSDDDPDKIRDDIGKVEVLADTTDAKIKPSKDYWKKTLDRFVSTGKTKEAYDIIMTKYDLTAAQEKELNSLLK